MLPPDEAARLMQQSDHFACISNVTQHQISLQAYSQREYGQQNTDTVTRLLQKKCKKR
mgnify:FL=1